MLEDMTPAAGVMTLNNMNHHDTLTHKMAAFVGLLVSMQADVHLFLHHA